MCRIVLGAAAALLAFGMAVEPARADDRDLCNHSKNEGSMAACNRLLQQAPNDVVAYNGRGLGYYLRRDYDRAIADFAVAYADQNERDFEALGAAASSGRIAVETGV